MTNTTNTDVKNSQADSPSDARIILGPLLRHAAIGLVLVAIILGTVVMVDRERSRIHQEVAQIEAEIAEIETMVTARPGQEQQPAADESTADATGVDSTQVTIADTDAPARPTTTTSGNADTDKPINMTRDDAFTEVALERGPDSGPEATTTQALTSEQADGLAAGGNEPPTTTTTILEPAPQKTPVALTEHRNSVTIDKRLADIISEGNAFLNDMDQLYLESYKASQERQLRNMRERLTRQEQRIKEMEARFKERYEIRADDMQEMREYREDFLTDRI